MWITTKASARLMGKKANSLIQAIRRHPEKFQIRYERDGDVKRLMIAVTSLSASAQAKFWRQEAAKKQNPPKNKPQHSSIQKTSGEPRVTKKATASRTGAIPECMVSTAGTPTNDNDMENGEGLLYEAAPDAPDTASGAFLGSDAPTGGQLDINFEEASQRGEFDEAMRRHHLIEDAINGRWKRIKGTLQEAGTNGNRRLIAVRDLDSYLDLIAAANGLGKSTLWTWYKKEKSAGLLGLARKERSDTGRVRSIDEGARAFIRASWLSGKPVTIREVHRQLAAAGWKGISRSTMARWIQDPNNINPAESDLARRGEKFYHDHHEKIILRRYDNLNPNDIAVGDHHEFDLFLRNDRGQLYRPWLTSFIDMKSRAVLGYHISDNPNSQTIAMAIRHMILPKKWDDPNGFPMHGLPVEIFVDNGKDYWCHQLTGERRHLGKVALDEKTSGLLPHLGINQRHAIPYNARSKMVERWHGTLELFVQNLPGYCGHDTKQRPESLKADLKAHEAWQKVHDLERPARFGTIRTIEEEKMIAGFAGESPFLTDREFLDVFEGWLTQEYHQRVSEARGIAGRTPLNVWTQDIGQVRELAGGVRMLDILLQKREQRVVQQSGVAMFGIGAQRRWYEADILWSGGMMGQTVEVLYDPNDISEIYLYYQGKFLATATTRKLLSMKIERDITTTESDVRQAIREQRRQMREFEKSIEFAREAAEIPDALERYVKKNRDLEEMPAVPDDFPMAVNQSISVMPNDAVAREAYRATAPGAVHELPLRVVHRREEEDLGVSNFEDLMDEN